MPGMQAAFVEIGLERAAFLHANDIVRAMPTLISEGAENGSMPTPPISELVHEGQDIVVQVVKDPISSKGARLTTHLVDPVAIPRAAAVREDDRRFGAHRGRGRAHAPQGPHARTARVPTRSATAISATSCARMPKGRRARRSAEDLSYLGRVWQSIREDMVRVSVGQRVYEDLSLPLRALRDLMRADVEKVRVDSRETFEKTVNFTRQFMPELAERIEHYAGERPIFDLYGVEDEIQRALKKEVPLKSGGYLIIDQTEAMTTIDVNTGAFLGHRNLEETVYKTNLEAAQAAARQLRLRNLGGIIIIDFIDMTDAEHKRQVLRMLEKSLAHDHAKTTVYEMSHLGLVEMTRKRTVESLERQLCEPCPACEGRGSVKTAETVTYEIFREITRAVRQFEAEKLLVLAATRVVGRILDEESAAVAELEEFTGKTIRFQAEEHYAQEQYDVVLL